MNFILMPDEAPSDSLRRIAAEQIDGAVKQLQRRDDLNEGIHEARKHFKRVRALLRLARGALPAETYVVENQSFRELGRLLSPVRDSAVHIETLDLLQSRHQAQMTNDSFVRLRTRMVRDHRTVLNEYAQDEDLQESIFESLLGVQHRVKEWRFLESEFFLFRDGLRKIYGRGRAEKTAAFVRPTTEYFHAWRKRVKYLWHHLQILQPMWPAQIKVLVRDCDRLADRLGEEHDLAVLLATPNVQEMMDSDRTSADQLLTIVSRERERQRRAAIPLAQRIYVESAGRFVDRIEGYWLAYRPHSLFLPQGSTGRGGR